MAKDKVKVGLTFEAFDKVTAPLKRINASLETIRRPVSKLQNSFRGLSQAAGIPKLKSSLMNVGSAISNVGSEVLRLGRNFMIFGGLAVAGLWRVINGTAETADKLAKLSKATGMGVESIQTLGFAFEQSGGSAEQFESAIGEFSTKLGQARNGVGRMAGLLKKADPQLLRTLRNATDTGDAFRAVFAGVARAKTDADRMALATAAFGQGSAVAIVNLAKEGESGLAKLEEEMQRMGVITAEEAKGAEAFDDAWNGVRRSFTSLKNKALLPLMPVLTILARSLQEWFIGKKDDVEQWGKDFAKDLPRRLEILKEHLKTLRNFLKTIWNAFKWITGDALRLKIALGFLAGLIGAKLIVGIALLGKAIIGLGWSMMTTPIGWFIGVLAGLAAIAYVIIKNWDSVKAFFVKLWESPIVQALPFVGLIKAIINLARLVKDNWEPIKKFFQVLWAAVIENIKKTIEWMEKLAKKFDIFGVGNAVKKLFGADSRPPKAASGRELGASQVLQNSLIQKTNNAAVSVRFENMPKGARISTDADPGMNFELDAAYMGMQGAMP